MSLSVRLCFLGIGFFDRPPPFQFGIDEGLKVPLQDLLVVALFVAGAVVFDAVVVEDIAADPHPPTSAEVGGTMLWQARACDGGCGGLGTILPKFFEESATVADSDGQNTDN